MSKNALITEIHKFYLKLFNKKQYQELKHKLKEFENYENYKKIIDPALKKISESIKSGKNLSFLHSGHLGDIIYSLPLIKEISKNSKCIFYLEVNKKMPKEASDLGHPFGRYFLSENAAFKLMPLIKKQKYISNVQVYNGEKIDINLNLFRNLPINFNIDCIRWYFHLTGVHANLLDPSIEVDPHETIKNRIVIMRSLRRQNRMISYKFLNNYESPLFVGLKDEYEELKYEIDNLEHYDCSDFYELASIIKSSKIFIGNLSFGYALAESIKVKRLLESGPNFPLVYPNGTNAYDFYFQNHFEELFNKLYKN
tara:strand:+ start:1391 stop:2323 length:933 start_codon:yes stop_codon:yes gene_type:complete